MDLLPLIREVRPTGDVVDFESARDFSGVTIVYGEGPRAARWFCDNALALEHGSVFVLLGGDEGIVADVSARVSRAHFHVWHEGPFPGLPAGTRTWIKHEGGGYGSHLEVLLEAARRTTGAVLELGGGETSTTALHEMLLPAGRRLVTVESDATWASLLRDRFARPGHEVVCEVDPAKTRFLDEDWSVVFVDHAPGETRAEAIRRAAGRAELVVVHDTEELSYGVEPALAAFRYRRDHRRYRPWTTVVSDVREVW